MPDKYSQDNLNRWIEGADIDYFTHFIRAWIPFNAWYKHSYTSLHTDREIINKIKTTSNEIRNAIENHIMHNGNDDLTFKNYIADLHHELQRTTLENSGKRITFENIVISNNLTNQINESKNGIRYFLKRTDTPSRRVSLMECRITNSVGSTLCSYSHTDYDNDHFISSSDYLNLRSKAQKEYVRDYFNQLNPYKPVCLTIKSINVDDTSNPSNAFICSDIFLIMDTDNDIHPAETISKGLIEIIYLLRCTLFHGELNPTGDAKMIYKNAYNILRILIDRIR